MNGSYTPRTLPVGGEEAREVSPRSLAEALLVNAALNCMQILWVHMKSIVGVAAISAGVDCFS